MLYRHHAVTEVQRRKIELGITKPWPRQLEKKGLQGYQFSQTKLKPKASIQKLQPLLIHTEHQSSVLKLNNTKLQKERHTLTLILKL